MISIIIMLHLTQNIYSIFAMLILNFYIVLMFVSQQESTQLFKREKDDTTFDVTWRCHVNDPPSIDVNWISGWDKIKSCPDKLLFSLDNILSCLNKILRCYLVWTIFMLSRQNKICQNKITSCLDEINKVRCYHVPSGLSYISYHSTHISPPHPSFYSIYYYITPSNS